MKIADRWLRLILAVLYRRRSATRGQIVEDTGLNPASVSIALRHLFRYGVVQRIGELRSTGGRRREVLRLNPESGYFLVVDMEGMRIRLAFADLLGGIRDRREVPVPLGECLNFRHVLAGMQDLVEGLRPRQRARLLAMGVSYTGLLDEAGRVTAVNLGWNDFPLIAELENAFDLPVFFGVDGYCKLLAERWFGAAQNSENCIYLMAGLGLGIGACINGQFLRGCKGLAGEFGHITVDPSALDLCGCGKKGCVEAIASSPNIVRQYLEHAGRDPKEQATCTVSEVFELARRKDPAALAAVTRAARYLGMALAHLVNTLNPDAIVLGGDLVQGADVMTPLLEEQLDRHCLPRLRECVALRTSTLVHDAGLRGAAALAFRSTLRQPSLLKRMAGAPAPKVLSATGRGVGH